jgi:catechol 2,3-dioxygenase-like lactoylglutathione lyase family enzyme
MFRVNHIHLKAHDPKVTAQWYVDTFGAQIVGEGQGLGGSQTVRLDIEGVRINVTSAPAGETLPEGTAVSHYGLEHFGFDTDDIEGVMARLEAQGVGVLMPVTQSASGNKISYIEGPDNVRIELVQAQ